MKQTLAQTFHLSSNGRELLGGVFGFISFLILVSPTIQALDIDSHQAPDSTAFILASLVVVAALLVSLWIASRVAGERAHLARRFVALCVVVSGAVTLFHNHEWASGWLAAIVLTCGGMLLLANAYLARSADRAARATD